MYVVQLHSWLYDLKLKSLLQLENLLLFVPEEGCLRMELI